MSASSMFNNNDNNREYKVKIIPIYIPQDWKILFQFITDVVIFFSIHIYTG